MNKKLHLSFIIFLTAIFISRTAQAGDIKGKVQLAGSKSNANVLVYIEYVDGSFAPPEKHVVMDQKNLMFHPKILPILLGTTVDFLNSDNVFHNVFTPTECAGSFNLGTWPTGEIRSHTFNDANCFVTILCDVHPDMQAWIAVLQNPFFVQTNKSGEFEIKNVPQGKYILKVWYPFYKTVSTEIEIKSTGSIRKYFTLKK
ncbi:MAG: carboxypeptidase-like regulatory domain-containing protein [Bacteroidetes bacterium]|nr:carboxypeptidase-like regulatory domain-containing protein [Bacteroidota bacterium]